eukprot:TRINITY_DN5073_c0_g1_i14.p2 TRINITY_DN5073_c0_g1~~TRINITY_DN5073_c0_g1_i14.p2  ORF type:complete len:138 (-),score=26.50 TRINITY_DN5073_c0_g1_i14:109-522(-)
MNAPADLSPETLAWVRMQMTIAAARAVEPITAELHAQQDFATGLLIVLAQLVPDLLVRTPELAEKIAPQWRASARYYEDLEDGEHVEDDGSPDLHEARKLIFDACAKLGVWRPKKAGQKPSCHAPLHLTNRRPPQCD